MDKPVLLANADDHVAGTGPATVELSPNRTPCPSGLVDEMDDEYGYGSGAAGVASNGKPLYADRSRALPALD